MHGDSTENGSAHGYGRHGFKNRQHDFLEFRLETEELRTRLLLQYETFFENPAWPRVAAVCVRVQYIVHVGLHTCTCTCTVVGQDNIYLRIKEVTTYVVFHLHVRVLYCTRIILNKKSGGTCTVHVRVHVLYVYRACYVVRKY